MRSEDAACSDMTFLLQKQQMNSRASGKMDLVFLKALLWGPDLEGNFEMSLAAGAVES